MHRKVHVDYVQIQGRFIRGGGRRTVYQKPTEIQLSQFLNEEVKGPTPRLAPPSLDQGSWTLWVFSSAWGARTHLLFPWSLHHSTKGSLCPMWTKALSKVTCVLISPLPRPRIHRSALSPPSHTHTHTHQPMHVHTALHMCTRTFPKPYVQTHMPPPPPHTSMHTPTHHSHTHIHTNPYVHTHKA